MGMFDHLIPKKPEEKVPRVGMFDHLVPNKMSQPAPVEATSNVGGLPDDASQVDFARESMKAAEQPEISTPESSIKPGLGQALLWAEENNRLGATQRTDPAVYDGTKPLRKKVGILAPADSDLGPGVIVAEGGKLLNFDPKHHVALVDPMTGRHTAFERNPGVSGTDQTEENMFKSIGRLIAPGLITSPVTHPAAAATIASRAGQALSADRAANAARDLASLDRLNVPVPPGAFSSSPVRGTIKQLSDIPYVGYPALNQIENSYKGLSDAVKTTADAISPTATFDKAGQSLQSGLDRFRTSGIVKIEPGVLAERGIEPRAPVQAKDVMSKEAAKRAIQAEPVRIDNSAGVAETQRGVEIPAARTRNQTITARKTAEHLDDAELRQILTAPADQTSFAVRSEALYENADRQIPRQMRINETANPQQLLAVNAKNAFNQIRNNESKTGVSGGIASGRFGGMGDKLQNNVSLPKLRAMRTEIGRALSNFGLYETGLDRTQLKQIYSAISKDMEVGYQDIANRAHIASRLGGNRPDKVAVESARAADKALYEFRRADRYFRQGIQRMDTFASVVGAKNPEMAAKRLVSAATGGGKGDIAMFTNAMKSLRPEERADFSALVLRELGTPQDSALGIVKETGFSPQSFVRRYTALEPRSRQLLFPGEHAAAVDDLVNSAMRLADVERMANVSRSGTNAINMTGIAGLAGSLYVGDLATPLALGTGGMTLSYLLSRPAYARWAAQVMRAKAAVLAAPNKANTDVITHMNRLAQLAKKDPNLFPIYQTLASEEGIVEGGDNNRKPDNSTRANDSDKTQGNEDRAAPHSYLLPSEPEKVHEEGGPVNKRVGRSLGGSVGDSQRNRPLADLGTNPMGYDGGGYVRGFPGSQSGPAYVEDEGGNIQLRPNEAWDSAIKRSLGNFGERAGAMGAGVVDTFTLGNSPAPIRKLVDDNPGDAFTGSIVGAGPAMSGIGKGIKALYEAPRAVKAGLGAIGAGLGLGSDPAGSESSGKLPELYEQKKQLASDLAQAQKRKVVNEGKPGPIHKSASEDIIRYSQQLDAVNESIKREEDKNDPDFKREQDEKNRLRQEQIKREEMDKPFVERIGYGIPEALTLASYLAPAALARYGLGKIANKGDVLTKAVEGFRREGDLGSMAEAVSKLNQWRKSAPRKQLSAVALPATIPLDIQAGKDVWDRETLPPTSKAQQTAERKLSDYPQYVKDHTSALVTGLVSTGIGAKLAQTAPREDARALMDLYGKKDWHPAFGPLRPMRPQSPVELEKTLGNAADATGRVQGRIREAGDEMLRTKRATLGEVPKAAGPKRQAKSLGQTQLEPTPVKAFSPPKVEAATPAPKVPRTAERPLLASPAPTPRQTPKPVSSKSSPDHPDYYRLKTKDGREYWRARASQQWATEPKATASKVKKTAPVAKAATKAEAIPAKVAPDKTLKAQMEKPVIKAPKPLSTSVADKAFEDANKSFAFRGMLEKGDIKQASEMVARKLNADPGEIAKHLTRWMGAN